MFARALGVAALLGLTACASQMEVHQAAPATGVSGPALAQACTERDGWSDPAPPARIFGNVYFVGTCGITVLLVTSAEGHVLIDGATAAAAAQIEANIRRLGFDPRDVRLLLNSHEHDDHAAGLPGLKERTGGRMVARAEARASLESGGPNPADPQLGITNPFAGVRVDTLVRDGEAVRVGPLALTAHATTGHTFGSTSWSWRSCEGAMCREMIYADSLTAISADGYRFTDHPALVAQFRATYDKVAAMRCDILITPHPQASNLFARVAGQAPLVDASACRTYAEGARRRLDERLAREAGR